MANLRNYEADKVRVVVAGVPITSGYDDGEFCRIEPEADAFGDVAGTDGEVTRFKTNDRRATVTVIVMQSSEVNALLSALYNSDVNSPNGVGIGPLTIQDPATGASYTASKSWISRRPAVSYDRSPTSREWTFRVADLNAIDGA